MHGDGVQNVYGSATASDTTIETSGIQDVYGISTADGTSRSAHQNTAECLFGTAVIPPSERRHRRSTEAYRRGTSSAAAAKPQLRPADTPKCRRFCAPEARRRSTTIEGGGTQSVGWNTAPGHGDQYHDRERRHSNFRRLCRWRRGHRDGHHRSRAAANRWLGVAPAAPGSRAPILRSRAAGFRKSQAPARPSADRHNVVDCAPTQRSKRRASSVGTTSGVGVQCGTPIETAAQLESLATAAASLGSTVGTVGIAGGGGAAVQVAHHRRSSAAASST